LRDLGSLERELIDQKSLEHLVEQHVKATVDQQVLTVLQQHDWVEYVEQRIISHIQDRITARFANMTSIPEIVTTIENRVDSLIKDGHLPGIEKYVDNDLVAQSVDRSMQVLINDTIKSLMLDPEWLGKIETSVQHLMTQKVGDRLSSVDLSALANDAMVNSFDDIAAKIKKNFRTDGIVDQSDRVQLTVLPTAVVAEDELIANDLEIQRDANIKGTLSVNNLAVKGSINTDNQAWNELGERVAELANTKITDEWKSDLVSQVLDIAKTQGIEFASVMIDGSPLVQGHELNSHITSSKIEHVGVLRNLSTHGSVNLSETVTVDNRRVGINTKSPEMALTVWDEEVSLLSGKLSQDHAYLGTGRRQSLSLGVNRKPHVTIDVDGLVSIAQLRIDRWRISHSAQVPGWSGTRGDLVFNSDPKPNTPFAWVCLGTFRWQPLQSA